MKTIPEEDEWFCPDCKNEDDIVKAGEKQEDGKKKKKMASKANPQSNRDWGKVCSDWLTLASMASSSLSDTSMLV